MNDSLPETMFERGRRETTANQPRFYEKFRELLPQGLAFSVEVARGENIWLAGAPWTRLEQGVLHLFDLAVPGEAGLHRIEFEEILFTSDTWGWFMVGGNYVVDFRPLVDAEDEVLIRAWNEHSGLAPLPLPVPLPPYVPPS